MSRNPISEEERQMILDLYKKGMPAQEIAQRTGRTWKTINEIRVKAGVQSHSTQKKVDYSNKCGTCKWLDLEHKSSIGYPCTNPDKEPKPNGIKEFAASKPCCTLYERRSDG